MPERFTEYLFLIWFVAIGLGVFVDIMEGSE